jgi:hypothetical protein
MEKMIALLAVIAVLVVIALFAFSGYVGNASAANQNSPDTTQADTAQVSGVISDQYASMLSDQLNTQTDDPAYNAQMQDSIADDMSKFYA